MADYARRHYTALAKILSASRMSSLEQLDRQGGLAVSRELKIEAQAKLTAYAEVESQLVTLFQADNVRFNADRFRAAAAGGAE